MNISIYAADRGASFLQEATHCAELALERYAHAVREVTVRLRDENGPRGGRDQDCVVRVSLRGAPEVLVRERRERPLEAVGRALQRARRGVAERLKSRRDWTPRDSAAGE
jgi:hypothetical protein